MTSPHILLKAWNLRARKRLGQNFLTDPSTAEMIVKRSGVTQDDVVLEIGSGFGALTIQLAKHAKRVYAVEIDSQIADVLKRELVVAGISNVTIMTEDILRQDVLKIGKEENRKLKVFGNLPYNISSQVLVKLIRFREVVSQAFLMFQKEMANRLLARPGGRDYGRLTVMLHYCAEVKSIAEIHAGLFHPRPKIDSQVLYIDFDKAGVKSDKTEDFLFNVIKAAFGRRRKTLKNSLAGSELPIDAASALQAIKRADIDPVRRAETLTVDEYIKLSDELEAFC